MQFRMSLDLNIPFRSFDRGLETKSVEAIFELQILHFESLYSYCI